MPANGPLLEERAAVAHRLLQFRSSSFTKNTEYTYNESNRICQRYLLYKYYSHDKFDVCKINFTITKTGKPMTIQQPDAAQIRGALGLLRWENEDLAKACNITPQTISNIKRGVTRAQPRILAAIRRVFEYSGIEFLDNSGVRFKTNDINVYDGPDHFDEFYDFLYDHLNRHGGEVCLSVDDERLLAMYRKNPAVHYDRMQNLSDKGIIKSFRILANKSHFATKYPYNSYKWQPGSSVAPTAFYAFGDCLALISFTHNPPPYVVVLQSAPLAEAYRQAFEIAWAVAKVPPPSKAKEK
jgi:transcriptional regulator with XRE-family HTH domain